jgi:CRISPR-associated endoribonuclease Cas6
MIATLGEPPVAAARLGMEELPSPYALPPIPYLRLRCTLRARERAVLPPYKGSLLRGAFGHALRTAVCALGPRQDCVDCRLRRACLYTRLFETLIEGEPPPFLRGLPTSPRPYVFEPATEACSFAPGDPLDFDLVLLGQAASLYAYALLALERMAAGGLGRDRFAFSLDRVQVPEPWGGWRDLVAGGQAVPGAACVASLPAAGGLGRSRITLRFTTPTRLKSGDRILSAVDFRRLAFSMIRRTLEIAHFHVPEVAVDWRFRPLLDLTAAVRVVDSRLRWQDWQRYSNRQRKRMSLGGFVGELEIEGDLEPFAPLLRTAEVLHVGKNTTFGLGRMEIV